MHPWLQKTFVSRGQLKCDGTSAETRFPLSEKRMSPFKSAGASVQSTTGSRGLHISGSNAGYTNFRGSVKGTGYPLHSPVSPSLPLPRVTVCHHISTGVYPSMPLPKNYVIQAVNWTYVRCKRGRDSAAGIATCYGLDGPGIESRWGARFSPPVQIGPRAHPASYTMGTGPFPESKAAGAWR